MVVYDLTLSGNLFGIAKLQLSTCLLLLTLETERLPLPCDYYSSVYGGKCMYSVKDLVKW